MHSSLEHILGLLLAAILVVAAFRRINISPVLGYLAAGALIGPFGFKLFQENEVPLYIAEFGVVFLLFNIGLEMTFERLNAMRTYLLGLGTSQLVLTGAVIGGTAYMLGLLPASAIIIGGALALSSTAVVLQVLSERGELSTQTGRLSVAILILQDMAVAPLLVLTPILAGEEVGLGAAILEALAKAVVVLVAILLAGRFVLRPLFRWVGSLKSDELFAATTLSIVLGAAWITESAGLTLALGAFLAGLMLAETEFRHQVEADIVPFRHLLLGLFFMAVGMSIDVDLLVDEVGWILALAVLLIAVKTLVTFLLCRAFKIPASTALHTGLLLAQGSEFAFVLFDMAGSKGLLPKELAQALLVTITLTMALTPLLHNLGRRFAERLERDEAPGLQPLIHQAQDLESHIVIVGFGRVGRTIGRLFAAEQIPYVALETDPQVVYEGRKKGFPVYYGDVENMEVLNSVGIRRAHSVVATVRNQGKALAVVSAIRAHFPDIPIISRAWNASHAEALKEAGATYAVPEAFEAGIKLGHATLTAFGIPEHEIERVVKDFRNQYDFNLQDVPPPAEPNQV